MSYLGELRENARLLTAASLGVGAGLSLFGYASSIMAPYLLREFHWSKSQFALVGLAMFSTLLVLPFIGGATDIYGARRMALFGVLLTPAAFFGFSLMNGPFYQYLIVGVTVLAVGSLTTPVVYARMIAANFTQARGLALTIVTCTPALFGFVGSPLLTAYVEAFGWRSGYHAIALFVLGLGLIAVSMIRPTDKGAGPAERPSDKKARADKAVYRQILREPALWFIMGGIFLCVLQTPLHSSQLSLMLVSNQLTTIQAGYMVSVYAGGTIVGRIACGLALDRYPTAPVAAISMGLPAIGYAVLASSYDTVSEIAFAMFLIGLSFGAEGDLLSFLVARYFRLEIFSTVASLVYASVYLASATGALTLSLTLKLTGDSFALFLWLVTGAIVLGSLLLWGLRTVPEVEAGDDAVPASA